MKKNLRFLMLSALLLVAGCSPKQKDDLVITVENMNPNMVTLSFRNVTDPDNGVIDTVYADNGVFHYNYPQSYTYETNIKFYRNGEVIKAENGPARIYLVYFPGDRIEVQAKITEDGKFVSKVEGTELYDDLQKFNEKHSGEISKADSLTDLVTDPAYKGNKTSLRKQVTDIWRNIHAEKEKYISENPGKDLSGYFLTIVDPSHFDEYYDKIDSKVKDGRMKDYIDMIKKYHDDAAGKENVPTDISNGPAAYDFTLKDINGNNFSLSSLRGKHVVLDFWGSWCSWCIQGIPDMKALYEKYKGKLEIVGIDCGEPESAWKKAVKEYALPWINVYNGDNGVDTRYGVSAYPTKVVIGSDGNIIETFEGESQEFYVFVEKIMSLNRQ